jgi:hypothetical protein
LRVGDPTGRDSVGLRLPIPDAGQRDEVGEVGRPGQFECHIKRFGQRGKVHPVDAGKRSGQRFGSAEVSDDGCDAGRQIRLGRVGGQCADVVGAHVDQVIDDAPADVAGGAGHKDCHDFHATWPP